MSFTNKIVPPSPLVKSFHWTTIEEKTQKDIHKFSRVFLFDLQTELQNHGFDSSFFNEYFYGKTSNKYPFKHHESFISENQISDLSLSIEQNNTLKECLKFFFQDSYMTGDNQYIFTNGNFIEKDGSTISTSILSFPQILYIQLNRFRFNTQTNSLQ
jgi:uncharacterized UBP type Zn finger protein